MNKIFGFFSVFIFSSAFCFSGNITPSKIKKVVLFTNQALVEREATKEVKKGMNNILIETKAFNIDRDSLSVKVLGDGEIYGAQFKEIYLKEEPQENIKEIEKKIEELNIKKNQILDRISILDKKEQFLDSLIDFSKVQIPQDIKTKFPDTDTLEKTLSFLDEKLSKIYKEKETLNIKINDLTKEIELLKKKLNSLKSPGRKTKKIIDVLFNSKKAQKINIKASYITYNCLWQPFYKMNVPIDSEKANLIMFAKIKQKTGEDWENIKLSISNAVLLRGMNLPSLNSWFLNMYPVKRKASVMAFDKTEEKMIKLPERAAGFVQTARKETPLSFEYEFPITVSIKSKEGETFLPLFEKAVEGKAFYYSVPRRSTLTFLVYKAVPDKELLSGYMDVYFAGRFTGKTYLNEKKAGEPFYLNLGADRNVKVKRIKVKDKIKETLFKRFERKFVIRNLEYKILLENMKDKPIKIQVIDNIPVSRTDKIEVKNIKFFPQPKIKNYQDKEGVNLWELEIGKNEKKEIKIEFTVTYPKDFNLYGF